MTRWLEFTATAVAAALLTTLVVLAIGADGLRLANGQPVFGDYISFWSAGRAAWDGKVAELHNLATIAPYQDLAVPNLGYYAPWNSPPTFLLISAMLAVLPFPAAAITFLAIGGGIYLYAARKLIANTRALLFAVTMPAALYHLGTVQTGLLIAGVSGLALVWLDRRPLRAGALVGVLAIKPHLALLWPLLLAFSGRWRAFAAAAVSTLAFVLMAGLVFGFDAYGRFFENLGASQSLVTGQRIATPAYASLYGNLLDLGAPHALASALQMGSSSAALFVATVLFVRGERTTAGAGLCAATLLVSPYLFFYDFTLLGVGAALMGAPRNRFEVAAYVLAWSAGLSLALGYIAPLPLCPLAAWMVLMAAFKRSSATGLRKASGPEARPAM